MMRLVVFTLVGLVAAGVSATAQAPEAPPVTDAMLQDPAPGDWLMWRRTLNGWGYSPLDQIDRENVNRLRLVWTRGLSSGYQEGTPLAYGGTLYMPNPNDHLQAIDAATGDLFWEYRRETPAGAAETLAAAAGLVSVNRNVALYGNVIIDTGNDGYVYAVDAATGELAWETEIFDYATGSARHSSGPILYVVAGGLAAMMPVAQGANGQAARPLSAFFGLDNALPARANLLCRGASGQDGMPIVLSHTVDAETLQAEDFRIVTRSGSERTPICSTLRPASDPGELRTVLLIGEFGDAADDPPAKVLVVGDLLSDGVTGGPVNFRGTRTNVTPLDAGPSLVLAEVVPEDRWSTESRGSACPEGTQQVVRATWAGGVRLPNGDEPGDAERALYRVTVERTDGSSDEIVPAALADLGDRDNNHLLCLDTSAPAVSVSFPGGHLVDPNRDLNPDTHVPVDSAIPQAGANPARQPSLQPVAAGADDGGSDVG